MITHTYIHTYKHTYIHTYIHNYIHTYIHTYIQTVYLYCMFIDCNCKITKSYIVKNIFSDIIKENTY